jgi:hypothetical protein
MNKLFVTDILQIDRFDLHILRTVVSNYSQCFAS